MSAHNGSHPRKVEVEVTSSGEVRDVPPRSPDEIEADIEAQREQLAETIDALTAKLDVKSQARAKAAEVRDRATTDAGKPRPELLVGAGVLVAVVVGVLIWRHRG